MTHNRRKQFYIKNSVQGKYVLLTILLLVSYTIILLGSIFLPHFLVLSSDIPINQKTEAANVLLILHSNIWLPIAVLIVVCGIYSIFLTHRIAGPIFAFNRMAKTIAAGDLTIRTRLREKDEFKDLGSSFNLMADNLETLLVDLKEEYQHLSSYISELEKELQTKEFSEDMLDSIANNMRVDRDSIGKLLEQYKFRNSSDKSA